MQTSMWEYRQYAAGGDRPALARVWLSFVLRRSADGRTVPVPQRRRFRDQPQLLLVAVVA
jgi:hypothetical protein